MNIKEIADKHEAYMIAMRRYFHENPEPSGEETQTIAAISRELTKMGVDHLEIPNGGILAKIVGMKDTGRAVLLRADVDALNIAEPDENLNGPRCCKSKNEGVMHACGHDAHTAMLLGAALVLQELRGELRGTVYLCFERGEEFTGNIEYILEYVEKERIHLDSAFGLHVQADLDAGKICVPDTNVMAGLMEFDVTLVGKGGHGSRPDKASNPIDAFHAIYGALQAMRMTHFSPFEPLTYSIGKLQAGASANVIPQELTFGGTMRTFDQYGAGMAFYRELKTIIEDACRRYHCTPIYNVYRRPTTPVINDPECAQLARKAIGAVLGQDALAETEPWMGSETFSLYQLLWPGVFAFLGIRNEEKGTGAEHHNPYFDVDESVLTKGAACAAAYAVEFLRSDLNPTQRSVPGGYETVRREVRNWAGLGADPEDEGSVYDD